MKVVFMTEGDSAQLAAMIRKEFDRLDLSTFSDCEEGQRLIAMAERFKLPTDETRNDLHFELTIRKKRA